VAVVDRNACCPTPAALNLFDERAVVGEERLQLV
jgi:hypothetical protein